jgi:uncharacterized protein (TIGR02996 family)
MITGDSLLAAIIDSPADDAPRLVYADWLEENGDPDRAEFIRLQIALTNPNLEADRRVSLARRERELLAEHADRFAGPFAGKGLHWVFRRGFIHRFRHDGVYQYWQINHSYYLRLFGDGVVISVTSTGSPEQVLRWFDPEHPRISKGRYSLDFTARSLHVYFSSTGDKGTVDYTGTFEGQSILVDVHSRINGRRARERYTRVDV